MATYLAWLLHRGLPSRAGQRSEHTPGISVLDPAVVASGAAASGWGGNENRAGGVPAHLLHRGPEEAPPDGRVPAVTQHHQVGVRAVGGVQQLLGRVAAHDLGAGGDTSGLRVRRRLFQPATALAFLKLPFLVELADGRAIVRQVAFHRHDQQVRVGRGTGQLRAELERSARARGPVVADQHPAEHVLTCRLAHPANRGGAGEAHRFLNQCPPSRTCPASARSWLVLRTKAEVWPVYTPDRSSGGGARRTRTVTLAGGQQSLPDHFVARFWRALGR